MPSARIQSEINGWKIEAGRVGTHGEYRGLAVKDGDWANRIITGRHSGKGARQRAYDEIVKMVKKRTVERPKQRTIDEEVKF
jgi:integrase